MVFHPGNEESDMIFSCYGLGRGYEVLLPVLIRFDLGLQQQKGFESWEGVLQYTMNLP